MKTETENEINAEVRRVYEPRYGRSLSDDEVYEIRHNLRAFAEALMSIAERLYGRSDNLPEDEDGIQGVGHKAEQSSAAQEVDKKKTTDTLRHEGSGR